jgi:hypothetical protein
MTHARLRVGGAVGVTAAVVFATVSTLNAQVANTAPRTLQSYAADPATYGTASNIVYNLQPEDFVCQGASWSVCLVLSGEVSRTNGGTLFVAAPLHLPNGAVVDSFEYFYYDSSPSVNPTATFQMRDSTGFLTDVAPVNFFPNVSNGSNSLLVVLQTPVTINNLTTHYSVAVNLFDDGTGLGTAVNRVRVNYRLQVSPAPGTATFADVPVGTPFHRFVEALTAAGITGGCGGGNYCPNAPITRGQMAVFLAAALGLHWPN